ncbi:MAG: hypothetical protein IJH41_03760 [Eubacterium sp.]|nr:hypothetical protein [Eubacterium sp.]
MSDPVRLVCPECGRPASERKKKLNESIAGWVYSDGLQELLRSFDIDIPRAGSLEDYIGRLREAVQVWDFRAGAERWDIRTDDPRIQANKALIEKASRELGLMDITEPQVDDPDCILPLGGARMTNYNTPEKARSIIESMDLQGVSVVGLSTGRPAAERDRPYYEQYAYADATEFEAMYSGIKKVFGLTDSFTGCRTDDENLYLCSEKRVFSESFRGGTVAVLSAPSSEPEKRRANTGDTFRYFLETFDIGESSRIILTTNCVYVPYQLMKLMKIAIEKDLMIDCVGVKAKDHIPEGKHDRYLQEIKATIDAIYDIFFN